MGNAPIWQRDVIAHHGAGDVRLLEQLWRINVTVAVVAIAVLPLELALGALGLVGIHQRLKDLLALLLGQ